MQSSPGLCSICNSSCLERISTQLYCSACNIYKTQQDLQPEFRFVSTNYRPNAEVRMSSKEFKIISLFQKLVDTYKVCGGSDVRLLNEEYQRYKVGRKKSQTLEAVTAVIFFYTYRPLLLKTMKDFAEENGIDRQEFHRCYKEYYDRKQNENSSTTADIQYQEQTTETVLLKCADFLKLIINDLLAKLTIKKNLYQEIIEAIMIKIKMYLEIDRDNYTVVSLIFRALKDLKLKISISNYAKICKNYGKATSPATIVKYLRVGKSDDKSDRGTSMDYEEEQ